MKIILSPSKTQDRTPVTSQKGRNIENLEKSIFLRDWLRTLSKNELAKLMKIKNKTLDQTYQLYQTSLNKLVKKPAIHMYCGVVFGELHLDEYTVEQRDYLNQHVVILSAMYGPLTPDTIIWPYRLDMTMKPQGIRLYEYWQDMIDEYFKDEIIINLASNEFSKMVKKQKHQMITIDFIEKKRHGTSKIVSVYAKQARGKMLDLIIKHQIQQAEDIKLFCFDGYHFSEKDSSDSHYVFIRMA